MRFEKIKLPLIGDAADDHTVSSAFLSVFTNHLAHPSLFVHLATYVRIHIKCAALEKASLTTCSPRCIYIKDRTFQLNTNKQGTRETATDRDRI